MALQRVEVKNPVGINTSLNSADLPLEAWSDANNVSFKDGKARKAQGYSSVFGTPPDNVLFLLNNISSGILYWYEATDTGIYRTEGTTHVDLSGPSAPYSATEQKGWTGGVLNTVVVLNNSYDNPQCLRRTDTTFIDLPNWPASTTCEVMRVYKNYLVALNVTKSGTEFPTLVKWSSPADPGEVPFTWDETDPTNDAGENTLADTGGSIVDGRKLRDSFYIYKEDSVYSMTYTGGVFVFNFRQIFDDIGALSKNSIAEFDAKHFVVGQGDVYVHNGVQKASVISGKMREYLFTNIRNDAFDRLFVVPDYANTEMWICYCSTDNNDTSDKSCDRALVWNWSENTWSRRDLPSIRYATYGIVDPKEPDWWDASSGSWDTETAVWGESNYNPSKLKILMSSPQNDKVYVVGNSSIFDGQTFESFLERTDISLGDDRRMKVVTSVTPHVKGDGQMQFYLGTSYVQNGPILWRGPFSYTIGSQYKVDCKVSGRYLAIKVVATSESNWELNGYTFELVPTAGEK